MKKLSAVVLSLFMLVISNGVNAGPLNGFASVYDPTGSVVTTNQPITGNLDVAGGLMSVSSFSFLGSNLEAVNIEVLNPGSYTRAAGDVTVAEGQVGAHIEASWSVSTFFLFMVWDVSPDGLTFTIADDDNDGVPGHAMIDGPFPGFSLTYDFVLQPAGPYVELSISVDGGASQECTSPSGAEVTVRAMPVLYEGAVLDSISWEIDNVPAGSGMEISETLSLGDHLISATALTTTGQSDTDSTTVSVEDTTRPELQVAFVDSLGNVVSTSGAGRVFVSVTATDVCDESPATSSSLTPYSIVDNGDAVFINRRGSTINVPVTSVRLDGSAADASGNVSTGSATLALE